MSLINNAIPFTQLTNRWVSAAAGVLTLILFLPGIFHEHNVSIQENTQSKGKNNERKQIKKLNNLVNKNNGPLKHPSPNTAQFCRKANNFGNPKHTHISILIFKAMCFNNIINLQKPLVKT